MERAAISRERGAAKADNGSQSQRVAPVTALVRMLVKVLALRACLIKVRPQASAVQKTSKISSEMRLFVSRKRHSTGVA